MPLCPICGRTASNKIKRHSDFEAALVYHCTCCSHHFAHPEPTTKWLAKYYQEIYSQKRTKVSGPSYVQLMKRRAASQVSFLRRHLLGGSKDCSNSFQGWRICDIGCGNGALVAQFQKEGASAKGFDTDAHAIEFGRRHFKADLYLGTLVESRPMVEQDLICLSHILEHLPDIRNSFQQAAQRLKRHGHLFIEIPNTQPETLTHPIDMESHIHFFSVSSLTAFLEKAGFRIVACTRCGPPSPETLQQKSSFWTQLIRGLIDSAWNRFFLLLNRPDRIITAYDGFYDQYHEKDDRSGIWIRCIATKGDQ